MRHFLCLLLATSLFISKTAAQSPPPNASPLRIEQIMQGEKFVGFLPENIAWSEDSRSIFFDWNPNPDTLRSRYKVAAASASKPEKVSMEELLSMPAAGEYNDARTKKIYEKNGDLFLLEFPSAVHPQSSVVLQVTNTIEGESLHGFSGDELKIIFQKGDNLFSWEIETGATEQLTDFRKGSEKKDKKKSKEDQFLYDDELALMDILAQRKSTRDARKRRSDDLKPKRPKPYYLGEQSLGNLHFSPDLRFVTFRLIDESEPKQTDVPNYVTESGQVEQLKSRPKVGRPEDVHQFGVFDRQRDTTYLVETKSIEGILEKPLFLKEYHRDTTPWEPNFKNPRTVIFRSPVFSEDGKAVVDVRSMDNKDRWLLLLDLPTGTLKLLDRQHDEAWIGGPGIGNFDWLPGGKRIWFQSEASGYSHLYALDVESGEKRALTSGNFEIISASLTNDGKHFYLVSNKETPFERHFYKMSVEGGKMEKITSLPGNHQVTLSPDERWLAVRYSFSNKPWELYVMPNQAGAAMTQLTVSTTPDFQKYPWREPELVWFKAADGADVPARLYRPLASRRNGAAVIFVHGAGYLQNVHRWWSNYYREFMFHNFLADNGFTVLDIDFRASDGYGRDWRTAIYRHMGGKDLSDQVDGARFLAEQHGIDPGRIGIYGGSYGGFITLMAMCTSPGTFRSGAALRSVTDWAHYNHEYTSNILNTPIEDSLAYRRSSPIYHAEGFTQGRLLLLHGMIDTNVQFQDIVRLSQRFIELGKENWELAVFPLEDHGFSEGSSWADEYKRIYKLFSETLRE